MKLNEIKPLDEASAGVDVHAATELEQFIDNDAQLYKSQFIPILKNLTKKKEKGNFNPKLAIKLFMYLMDAGAKKYHKDYGNPNEKWNVMFNKRTRELAASNYVKEFEVQYQNKEFDFMK